MTIRSKIVRIDRTVPFDPSSFIGQGWDFWRGPANSNGLRGEVWQDERSLALTEIDCTKIGLKTCFKRRESDLKGEVLLRRLQASGDPILLDAGIFQHFWNDPHLFSRCFEGETVGQVNSVLFLGNLLRSPLCRRHVLYLCRIYGELRWFSLQLSEKWHPNFLAAVLTE